MAIDSTCPILTLRACRHHHKLTLIPKEHVSLNRAGYDLPAYRFGHVEEDSGELRIELGPIRYNPAKFAESFHRTPARPVKQPLECLARRVLQPPALEYPLILLAHPILTDAPERAELEIV